MEDLKHKTLSDADRLHRAQLTCLTAYLRENGLPYWCVIDENLDALACLGEHVDLYPGMKSDPDLDLLKELKFRHDATRYVICQTGAKRSFDVVFDDTHAKTRREAFEQTFRRARVALYDGLLVENLKRLALTLECYDIWSASPIELDTPTVLLACSKHPLPPRMCANDIVRALMGLGIHANSRACGKGLDSTDAVFALLLQFYAQQRRGEEALRPFLESCLKENRISVEFDQSDAASRKRLLYWLATRSYASELVKCKDHLFESLVDANSASEYLPAQMRELEISLVNARLCKVPGLKKDDLSTDPHEPLFSGIEFRDPAEDALDLSDDALRETLVRNAKSVCEATLAWYEIVTSDDPMVVDAALEALMPRTGGESADWKTTFTTPLTQNDETVGNLWRSCARAVSEKTDMLSRKSGDVHVENMRKFALESLEETHVSLSDRLLGIETPEKAQGCVSLSNPSFFFNMLVYDISNRIQHRLKTKGEDHVGNPLISCNMREWNTSEDIVTSQMRKHVSFETYRRDVVLEPSRVAMKNYTCWVLNLRSLEDHYFRVATGDAKTESQRAIPSAWLFDALGCHGVYVDAYASSRLNIESKLSENDERVLAEVACAVMFPENERHLALVSKVSPVAVLAYLLSKNSCK